MSIVFILYIDVRPFRCDTIPYHDSNLHEEIGAADGEIYELPTEL